VVINDTHIYELNEQQPVMIENEKLPIKITAKNGFHFSELLTIDNTTSPVILLGVGCQVDNGKLIGCVLLSTWLFIIYFAIHNYVILALANLPILYIMYYFFWKPKIFLKVWEVKKK
jgi:CBS domain containing-hemolysin-like protein